MLDFVSDLHLQAADPATFAAWRRYLDGSSADALFILGDLFEAWIGDDAALQPGFAAECVTALRSASRRRPVFVMHGNRDFLLGRHFIDACGARFLNDPTVLAFAGRRWLLTHGDALCLADTEYQAFRARVRAPDWQAAFLALSLAERETAARALREGSNARQRSAMVLGDVDDGAALAWLAGAGADTLIHGHTHRPADHALDAQRQRIVLSDWDAGALPPRLQVLRLGRTGAQRIALD